MTDATSRFALPFILPGQAQKEVAHNEALAQVDALLHPVVEADAGGTPPPAPSPGQSWIVGSGSTGAWAGQAGALATWTEGGWRFVPPREGLAVWSAADGSLRRFRAGEWEQGVVRGERLVLGGVQLVGARRPPIADPAGGGTVDAEARGTIAAVLAALRHHGLIG